MNLINNLESCHRFDDFLVTGTNVIQFKSNGAQIVTSNKYNATTWPK